MPFLDSLDIANRALQLLGQPPVELAEDSKNYREMAQVYDFLRRAELRRNSWKFALRRTALRAISTTAMEFLAQAWDATVTYLPGAIVTDDNNNWWTSNLADNYNNEPGVSTAWDQYFGPVTADLYDADTTYYAGELVYAAASASGSYVVYLSLESDNDDDPETALAYDATTQYGLSDVVSYSGSQWRSIIAYNVANTPADAASEWDINATYTIAQAVTGSDGYKYTAVGTTTGDDPTTDGGVNWTNTGLPAAWDRTPTLYPTSPKWRAIAGSLKNLTFAYPIGSGPSNDVTSRNVFRLPANFLRTSSQNPKSSTTRFLDWEYEGGRYFTSNDTSPVIFRFVADVTDVTVMDDMFAEGLACRMALGTCKSITGSGATDFQNIGAEYKTFMTEARLVNAIEVSYEEPPEDEYLTVRL